MLSSPHASSATTENKQRSLGRLTGFLVCTRPLGDAKPKRWLQDRSASAACEQDDIVTVVLRYGERSLERLLGNGSTTKPGSEKQHSGSPRREALQAVIHRERVTERRQGGVSRQPALLAEHHQRLVLDSHILPSVTAALQSAGEFLRPPNCRDYRPQQAADPALSGAAWSAALPTARGEHSRIGPTPSACRTGHTCRGRLRCGWALTRHRSASRRSATMNTRRRSSRSS